MENLSSNNTKKGQISATAKIIIRNNRIKKNGKFSIVLRITYNRSYKIYNTTFELTENEFKRVINGKRRTNDENDTFVKLQAIEKRANEIIKDLNPFTFTRFEDIFLTNKTSTDTINEAFDEYIEHLNANQQIGTAINYNTAKNCFNIHFKGLKFADITSTRLKKFENTLVSEGKSLTTVSIYVRCLRAIFNNKNIPLNLQPFHRSGNKQGYKIPTVNNQKKALTVEQIALIYNYDASQQPLLQRAKDYWIFMFLCNGMNINDLCSITWAQINENLLTYQRNKTLGKSNTQNPIQVSLKAEAMEIIRKYGIHSILKNAFVFPHYKQGQTLLERKKLVGLLTRSINDYMAIISKDLNINLKVTTQFARHSFATVLKRANTSSEQISELLGHSSLKTTQHYLASFEAEQIHKTTDVLSEALKHKIS